MGNILDDNILGGILKVNVDGIPWVVSWVVPWVVSWVIAG